MEKLYTSKTFLKVVGERMHTLGLYPLDPSLAISYTNHQKSLAYFSHLAPLVLFFITKRKSQKEGGMAQCPPKYAPVTLYCGANLQRDDERMKTYKLPL